MELHEPPQLEVLVWWTFPERVYWWSPDYHRISDVVTSAAKHMPGQRLSGIWCRKMSQCRVCIGGTSRNYNSSHSAPLASANMSPSWWNMPWWHSIFLKSLSRWQINGRLPLQTAPARRTHAIRLSASLLSPTREFGRWFLDFVWCTASALPILTWSLTTFSAIVMMQVDGS